MSLLCRNIKLNKILLVEDDKDYAELLSHSLTHAGYNVEIASNIKEGYEKSNNIHPELIMLDVMLPDGNGYDLCSQLYSQDPTLPVIMLSAVRQSEEDKIFKLFFFRAFNYYLKETGNTICGKYPISILLHVKKCF